MSATRNDAEQAENAAGWFGVLSTKEENNNSKNSRIDNTNKYTPQAARNSQNMNPRNINNIQSNEFNEICKKAHAGQKVMILLRGAPGSGKSTLAKTLLQQIGLLEKHSTRDFVHSSDDFFYSQRGYNYTPNRLSDAHEWNRQRVARKAAAGWSPIIVDNTNIMVWEMLTYAQIAVQHGYLLELLEPQTTWSKSATKLAQRNVHQVPKENIQRMLDRYEKTSAKELIGLLKETKYTVPLPQFREIPPLPALPGAATTSQQPQPQPTNVRDDSFKLNIDAKSWEPYEQNAPNYWAQQSEHPKHTPIAGGMTTGGNSLLDLLRDEQAEACTAATLDSTSPEPLQRHVINCPNESPGFVSLRQMYPNKQLTGLWDLFVKCNQDVDWAVDILVKEDELNADAADYAEDALLLESEFVCDCRSNSNSNSNSFKVPTSTTGASSPPGTSKQLPKPQRQPRARRNGGVSSTNSSTNKELQLQIENCFVLGDDQYSDHTRKIRDIRNGALDQPIVPPQPPTATQSAPDEDDNDLEDNALVEMDLGEKLIEQLCRYFRWEGELLPIEPGISATKVFMPRHLAKQMYMVYMEAVHNQVEEQRQTTMREDEQFARLLKHPQYADCNESPHNVNELLDMELAWSIYNSEQQAAKQATTQKPNDIATHLTKMKLCEKFPSIPNDTVLEIFAATDNNYVQTVEVLDSNVQSELTGEELYEQALREKEKLNAEEQQNQQQLPAKLASPRSACNGKSQSPQLQEEAKTAALRDFEETRNLAAHHAQLRAECQLKAKQAIQRGNGGVALYYSQISELHKKKIDVFNHRAANCIMEVHKHTQNNPDLLDLHYLHALEAVSSLDLFLDRHITVLRNCKRAYKHVFIITGRGLHSANGVSTIKKRVKARLADRSLNWQEVNPGLLRVKIFSASRHSKNI